MPDLEKLTANDREQLYLRLQKIMERWQHDVRAICNSFSRSPADIIGYFDRMAVSELSWLKMWIFEYPPDEKKQ